MGRVPGLGQRSAGLRGTGGDLVQSANLVETGHELRNAWRGLRAEVHRNSVPEHRHSQGSALDVPDV